MVVHMFLCTDAHTCGNPVRVIAGGGPLLPHVPIAEQLNWVRPALMFEPRDQDAMSGTIISGGDGAQ